jgi:methyl-accepting chemotaxis protein
MTWIDLKIRHKVGTGLGIVIILSMLSSLVLLFNLLKVEDEINELSTRYIPSVNESSKMDRYWEGANGLMTALDLSGDVYFNQRAEIQIDNFTHALENLINLGDSSSNNLSSRNINLEEVRGLSNKFKELRINYTNAESESQQLLTEIDSQFRELNSKAENYKGSFAVQKTMAQVNFVYAQLTQFIKTKKGVSVASILNDNAEAFNPSSLPTALRQDLSSLKNKLENFLPVYKKARLAELKRYEAGKNLMWEVRKSSEVGLDYLLEMGDRSSQVVFKSKRLLIMAMILVIVIGIILAYFLASSISRPIEESTYLAEKVAHGDLNVSFAVNRKDEIGRLSASIDTMISNIKVVVDEIRAGAVKMVAASERLTRESSELSEGANQQASAAEEVSSSMEEMYANIQQNTDNSKETEKIALDAAEGIRTSNQSSQQAQKYLHDITEKISIIGDIAMQTNILALNAAVEAARAGQEGRGFAVVAAEVRKLAERSQHAAAEINTVSQTTIQSANEASENLLAITPEIEKTASLVQDITAASLEQVAGVEQINNALHQLNQITQRNAANSEEINSAAKELEDLSVMLNNSISVFKLGGEENKKSETKHTITSQTSSDQKTTAYANLNKSNSFKGSVKIDLGREFDDADEYEKF